MSVWFVCDMDDGILRQEPTRKDAVEWLKMRFGPRVLERHKYGPGDYEYIIGYGDYDRSSAFVIRSDRVEASGFSLDQPAMYPEKDKPHEAARESGKEPLRYEGDAK